MDVISYKYVYRHEAYGVIDSYAYDRDVKLKKDDYVRLDSRTGDEYYQVQDVRKIMDTKTSTLIILVYIKLDQDDIGSQIE